MTGLPRLNRTLGTSPALLQRGIEAPHVSLLTLPERAVQFGTGAFLRGFLGHLLDEANRRGLFGGRVVAVASTGSGRDDALREQDGLFTVATEHEGGGREERQYRIVSAWSRALSARHEWDAVLATARDANIELVFSNTTEVGIRLDDEDAADAALATGGAPPRSFPGKLARWLLERGRAFAWAPERGVVVVPCELIEANGETLRAIVLDLAARWGAEPAFARWLDEAVPFCDTLVDRIVPGAPTGENLARLRAVLGYEDALLTTAESYRLFAVRWSDGAGVGARRPALRERLRFLGAHAENVVAADIAPWRERKVRLLNGAHTLLAPAALLLGVGMVRDAADDPALGEWLRRTMLDEIAPTVPADGAAVFAEQVLTRFRNRYVRHALIDITLQGTMKLRVRVVPTILRHAARTGRAPDAIAFGLACFLEFMRGEVRLARAAAGLASPADDQAERLRALWDAHHADAAALARAALGDETLWGADLTAVPGLAERVHEHLSRVRTEGVRAALDHYLSGAAGAAREGSTIP